MFKVGDKVIIKEEDFYVIYDYYNGSSYMQIKRDDIYTVTWISDDGRVIDLDKGVGGWYANRFLPISTLTKEDIL